MMEKIDREKVIKGLECCKGEGIEGTPICEECPYADQQEGTCDRLDTLFGDILALLKAQEPVKAIIDEDDDDWGRCGNCGARLEERWSGAKYCMYCGREAKWE